MDFISNSEIQVAEMLKTLGISSVDELWSAIPLALRRPRPPSDDGMSEFEGLQMMEKLAAENTILDYTCYLGAGAYEHHVPAVVSSLTSRGEFLTSYTPYQAEASQGLLQAMFEFQTAICALTGMEVANASVYDGANAMAEAALMALRLQKGREEIVLGEQIHPHYRAVVEQYTRYQGVTFSQTLSSQTAAVIVQSPNYWGEIVDVRAIVQAAKRVGALVIQCANPLAYGLFETPGETGVDIAVGDAQPFGIPLQFGGPYVGYMACRKEYVRQLPGRIVGETTDTEGKRGYVLTLQAREQHIRREKATSNICTNQALAALASWITMAWYGKKGIPALALTNYQRAAYLKQQLASLPGITVNSNSSHFNEFTVQFAKPISNVIAHFEKHFILPGVVDQDRLIVAVTETKSKEQLDRYVEVARGLHTL